MKKFIFIFVTILSVACMKDSPVKYNDIPEGYAVLKYKFVDECTKSVALDTLASGEVYAWMQTLYAPDSTIKVSLKRKVNNGSEEYVTPIYRNGDMLIPYGTYTLRCSEAFEETAKSLTFYSTSATGGNYTSTGTQGVMCSKLLRRSFSAPEFSVYSGSDTVSIDVKKSLACSVIVVDTTECKVPKSEINVVITNGKYQAYILSRYNLGLTSLGYTSLTFEPSNEIYTTLYVSPYFGSNSGTTVQDKVNFYTKHSSLTLAPFYGFKLVHPYKSNVLDINYGDNPEVPGVDVHI